MSARIKFHLVAMSNSDLSIDPESFSMKGSINIDFLNEFLSNKHGNLKELIDNHGEYKGNDIYIQEFELDVFHDESDEGRFLDYTLVSQKLIYDAQKMKDVINLNLSTGDERIVESKLPRNFEF